MRQPRLQAGAEKLDSNMPSVEESIARARDPLIINPDSFPLGPDGHREPVAGPARNLAREERTGLGYFAGGRQIIAARGAKRGCADRSSSQYWAQ
jgi:hypothetical protein